ncbi:PucR family transcriptional regulator [Amycolatopsis suaedae]|uniref:PucR family transcriptional regulator n=1 Tax=Amycolatopsis suaedae TaxID=2510978 RepID=A0A4Q7J117_9PSEU|nr:helix-turn-helix domain-containing protein [Amycolatopsis suaedae]RZQ60106.1 PucR family transcriptional regulator [Amycolatopsis suaedae]
MHVRDTLDTLGDLPAGALAVLTPSAAGAAHGHVFDIALRNAAMAGVAAVVLAGVEAAAVERSAQHIADRNGLALLVAPEPVEPARVVAAVAGALRGDPVDSLAQIDEACRRLRTVPAEPKAVLEAAGAALGTRVVARATAGTGPAVPVPSEGGGPVGYLALAEPSRSAGHEVAVLAVLQLAAHTYAHALAAQRRASLAGLRDRGRLLGELIFAPDSERGHLGARARALGMRTDGWHQVLRFTLASPGADQLDTVTTLVLEAVRDDDRWYCTLIGGDPLLVHALGGAPGPSTGRAAQRAARAGIDVVRERFPGLSVRCGIGSAQRGEEGLRTSAAEAKAALVIGQQSDPPQEVVAIDALNLNRMLVAWYAAGTARATADELLSPLTTDTRTATDNVRTLQAYLDHQNSPKQAAAALKIHAQTVNYRIRRIRGLLDADLDDPDQRLALQLACRAWLLN